MGFISSLSKATKESFPGSHAGQALWRDIFGTTKEEIKPQFPKVRKEWASSIATEVSYKRLLQAMRSMAPGGWSDDRWEQTKHFVGAAYVAIDRISKQIQQAELEVFIKDRSHPDGKRLVTPDDPPQRDWCKPYDLVKLLERPNRQDSFGKMMYRLSQQQRLTGTALTWMVPNQFGVPYELYVIPTAIAIPQACINPDFPDGYYRIQPIYPYGPFSSWPTPATAVGAPIPAQWMLRFQYPHPLLRYDGYSPLSGMRFHMDELEMMDRSRAYKMKSSTNPSAVLNLKDLEGAQPLPESELERIHVEWQNEHGGPENHGGIIVCPPGGTLEEFGTRPIDMDYPTGWDQLTSFVLGGGFGITKQAAGMIEDSAYATLFATLKQLHLVTLSPDTSDYAQEYTHHLAPFFGDNLIVQIKPPRIDDHEISMAKVGVMIQGRLGTVNEARKELGLPIVAIEWGEERLGELPEMPGMVEGETTPQPTKFGDHLEKQEQDEAPSMEAAMESGRTGKPTPHEEQDASIEKKRPGVGKLGRQSLGPRKRLPQSLTKRINNGYKTQSLSTQTAREKVLERWGGLFSSNGKH